MTARLLVLCITLVVTAFIALLTIEDIVQNGLSAIDIVALGVIALFTIGICGALWESLRGGDR